MFVLYFIIQQVKTLYMEKSIVRLFNWLLSICSPCLGKQHLSNLCFSCEIVYVCLIRQWNFYFLFYVCCFILFFSCVTVARSNENHSIMQADNWMICWVRAKCMIRLPGNAKISGDECDLWPQQKNKARLIVSLT